MIVSKTTIFLIFSIIIFSVILSHFGQQLDTNNYVHSENQNFKPSETNVSYDRTSIIWFLQISDIHISIFHDKSRITEFKEFCSKTIDAIQPAVVLASGDLTDAKHKNNMGSGQHKEEWTLYKNTLKEFNVQNKTVWLDIRGNHDNFDVPNWDSSQNYFKDYSIQGVENKRSYMHVINKGEEKIAFIAVDACLEPGPRRPFNFMGMLTNNETENIKNYVKQAEKMKVKHIIWFGHYPSSCIFPFGDTSLRDIIGSSKSSKVYLCGHLHTLAGLVTEMYTIQKQGFLELELGDWKDNRMFRLLAIDNGLLSFVDNQHGEWPIALITNPKHSTYTMPSREPLIKMKLDNEIRILAFSLAQIRSVHAKIDDGEWFRCYRTSGPKHVGHWNPAEYSSGAHVIYIKVEDFVGRQRTIKQPFSLDGSKEDFKMLPKAILMLDATTVFQSMFGTMIIICIIPLLVLRYMHDRILLGKSSKFAFKRKFTHRWLRKFWIVANVDCLFYPLVAYEVYLIFGPWFIGEVLDGYIGAIFSWGIIVNGIYIPGLFTYMYGFIQMFLCQFPLTVILANCANERFKLNHLGKKPSNKLLVNILKQLPFIIILTIQSVLAYFFWLAYGTLAFLLGPLRSWSIILNIYLWYKSITLQPKHTREMIYVWEVFKIPNLEKKMEMDDLQKS